MSADTAGPALRLKELSAAEYSRLSALLDLCIDLVPEARGEWLIHLESEDPRSAAMLRKLLSAPGAFESGALPETRDIFTRHFASLAQAQEVLAGKRIGPYRILSLLGQGGMGSVWLAERADGLFTRQVALKLVHPVLIGHGVTERFAREREILASLSHPNIARLLDAGFAEDGQPYLALQYVAGTPITTYCDRARLGVNQRLHLFLQVLNAVRYAHANLVIHRDLKPSNILVTEDGQVQLLDFGIAKLLTEGEGKETALTQLAGRALTPDYAAPEQISGEPITTAADVYALGVMLYELLTGEQPYRLKRDTRGALEEAILQVNPLPPSRVTSSEIAAGARATTANKLARTLKGDLDTIAMKALKKSPTERYATADAFGEDVARFLRGDVVLAQPDSVIYRARKFVFRHRVGFAAASLLILTLAGGLAATTYEAEVASAQRDVALQAQLRSLTQTAAARLKEGDVSGALSIILEVLPHRGATRSYTSEALSVFQEARAADAQVFVLPGHTNRVRSAAFSSDGRRVVTSSYDKTARIWDAATGREILLLSGHADRVVSAAFSPDGLRVVTASYDHTAGIWDAGTGHELTRLRGHTDRLLSVAYSPDGRRIVTTSLDKTARIWDSTTGHEILRLIGHTDTVLFATFSPDGLRIITASADKTARIWDATSGGEILLLSGHTEVVTSAAFSRDGRSVVTSSLDKTARTWDAATGREILRLSGHTGWVYTAAFSPDGRRVVTASSDQSARLWDTATGRQLMLLSGHTDWVTSADFSPDGRRIVTASADKTARIWDLAPSAELLVLSGHTGWVAHSRFAANGRRLVTTSLDKTARIWNSATGQQLLVLTGHTDSVWFAEFSPDGLRVATASNDRSARIWDATTGRQLMLLAHTDPVQTVAFSPDGRRVVTASTDRTARVWDAVTGRQLAVLTGHTDPVQSAEFAPDGRRVVTASFDKTARIWDALTGHQLMVLNGHADRLTTAAFSRDGHRVITASQDKTARIWDAATGRELMMLSGHKEWVNSAAFSPDGRRVVTASDDNTARIWDATTGREVLLLRGHTDGVISADFSPDGWHVVTGSIDGTARVWDARASPLDIQIGWAEAAQFDSLPGTERFQLGLPAPTYARQWLTDASKCDQSAAAPHDPDRRAPGVMRGEIVTDIAVKACAARQSSPDNDIRSVYQHGRALVAKGDFSAARRDFEASVAGGYRAAQVDLGMLLSQPSAGLLDLPRAISLYEHAWRDGVSAAAFQLGSLYEHGVSRAGSDTKTEYLLAPDEARAWLWYQKAADAGQPDALARFGQRGDDSDFSAESPAKHNARLLESFKYYAAAAERARSEDWPDAAWRNWRYRRASLARLLAREGMMPEAAEAYARVLEQYAPRPPTMRDRLVSLFRE